MTLSRLRLYYERPLKAHAIRDWMSAHPRLVIPIVAFLIGTLSYTVSYAIGIADDCSSIQSEPSSYALSWKACGISTSILWCKVSGSFNLALTLSDTV